MNVSAAILVVLQQTCSDSLKVSDGAGMVFGYSSVVRAEAARKVFDLLRELMVEVTEDSILVADQPSVDRNTSKKAPS